MKKVIYTVTLCVCVFLTTGCSEEDQGLENSKDATLQNILQITDDFLNTQLNTTPIAKPKALDPVYVADITAGVEEFARTYDWDGALHAGITASENFSGGIAPNNPGDNVDNPANEYDLAGKYHVDVLHYALTEKREYIFQNGIMNFQRSFEVTKNYLNANNALMNPNYILTESNFNTTYNATIQTLQNVNNSLSQWVLKMEEKGKISSLESQILHQYFNAQESATSLQAYIQYSLQIEDLVINATYSERTKKLLLFTMATARHDINYWNPYGNTN
jgi:hypothetical protein